MSHSLATRAIINLTLASCYCGYSACYFNTLTFTDTITIFSITAERALAQGSLSFLIVIGGAIGACLSSPLLRRYSRRQFLLYTNYLSCVAVLFLLIGRIEILFLARLVQGFTTGLFTASIPLCVKEISPIERAGQLGSYYQIAFTLGLTFSFVLAWLLDSFLSPLAYWRIMYGFPLIFLLLQARGLRGEFAFQTPKYLVEKGRFEEARELLMRLNERGNVEDRLEQIKKSVSQSRKMVELTGLEERLHPQPHAQSSSPLAVFTAFHLMIMQQFTGIQSVILYGGEITLTVFPSMEKIIPIFLHLEAVVAALFTSRIMRHVGRRPMILYGTFGCSCLSISMGLESTYGIIMCMFLFRALYGFTTGPVVNLYVAEIVESDVVGLAVMAGLISAGFIAFSFPLLRQWSGGDLSSVFLAYGIYSAVATAISSYVVVESRCRPQFQVRDHFERKWIRLKNQFRCQI